LVLPWADQAFGFRGWLELSPGHLALVISPNDRTLPPNQYFYGHILWCDLVSLFTTTPEILKVNAFEIEFTDQLLKIKLNQHQV
jgi:hypothetical protein